jgi:2-keto-3-deoxy-L-rhamnonate aldolase RhmA
VRHSEQAVQRSRDPVGRRAWADEAIRWATADKALIRANEQTLLAALR